MTGFSAIDLSRLPSPTIIERADFESVLADLKSWLIAREPELEFVLDLESEPVVKVLETWAYREVLLRAEFDDAARQNMLAFATGANLDHLAAFFGVSRLIAQEGDPTKIPPVPEIQESDTRLRLRTQLSLEGHSTAGPRGSYIFHGLSASAEVLDISVDSPTPGAVAIAVLATGGDGTPSADLVETVRARLSDDNVRPLTDMVSVRAAGIVEYRLEAALTLYNGPDSEIVRLEAERRAREYVERNHRLDHDITISGLHAALHVAGVQNVALASPAQDIVIGPESASWCTDIIVTISGRNV